jgi:glycosyltransferase involved in cell wall biosynthesis
MIDKPMDKFPSYWTLITVKNGEGTIIKSVESILSQTSPPSLICIVDDGSSDKTPMILSELKKCHNDIIDVITLPDNGYDIRRIVHNWNKACEYVKKNGKNYCYLLISSDDIVFPKDYVEKLIIKAEENPKLVIVSGSRGLGPSDQVSFPEGAGRLIKISYFEQIGYSHPPYYGYESWILYKALQMGYQVNKLNDIKYEHLREFGSGHKFVEYGPAMRCLGYHPLFIVIRVMRNLINKNAGISRTASIRMLFDYINKTKWLKDPYFHYFEFDLRFFVQSFQKKRLLNKVLSIIRK